MEARKHEGRFPHFISEDDHGLVVAECADELAAWRKAYWRRREMGCEKRLYFWRVISARFNELKAAYAVALARQVEMAA